MGRKSKATLEAEAAAAAGEVEVEVEVPAGCVRLLAPADVTAVSGHAVVDGAVVVSAELAETLVRMHGFVRG